MTDTVRVLITDEDPDSRVETRKALQRAQLGVAGEVGFGAQAVSLAVEAQADVILLAMEEPIARPLETAEALADVLPETPFIIYSSAANPEAIRRAMVFGARDYLVKPIQTTRLREAVQTALAGEERRHMRRAGQLLDSAARGSVLTVAGAKGGIGKTVVAVNLALALRQETGRSVVLVDADMEFGDVATMLDLAPEHSIAQLLRAVDSVDRAGIQGYLTKHASGLPVLAAPADPEQWSGAQPGALMRVLELLADTYDFVVIDTRGALDPFVRACMECSTLTLILTNGEVTSVRNTAAALRQVASWELEPERVKVVLNRSTPANGVSVEDLTQALSYPVFWQVPTDRRVPASVQLGQPVMLEGRSPAARSLADLARRVAGTRRSLTATEEKGPWWRRLGEWRRFRS
jgi:pilus assembly protein CpaE